MSVYDTHPRPQMARERWLDLCGEWGFAYDDADVGRDKGWPGDAAPFTRTISVPFPPESQASGIGDPTEHPIVWYRRALRLDPALQVGGQHLVLHFGAVDYAAQVWVNGHMVMQHEGGNTGFSADITAALLPGEAEQIIVVRAQDDPTDLAQPRGKQYWQDTPRHIWYYRTTGIWQPVWIEPVAPVHIASVRWTADSDNLRLGVRVRLNTTPKEDTTLTVELRLHGQRIARDVYTVTAREIERTISLDIDRARFERNDINWSPEYPNLIEATLILADDDGATDTLYSYAGLRSAACTGGRFLLNGKPYYLRMVLEQGYWPESLLAAPDAAALKREVELIKELGFNAVRIHQKVEDPRFLYWCDKLGLAVWGEMANAYIFSADAVQRLMREWLDVVERDYSHPCIVMWVPLNESWGVPNLERDPAQRDYVRALYHTTKALDPTRPVIGNDGWEHLVGDVWSIHDYAFDGATIRERYGTVDATAQTVRKVQPHARNIVLSDYAAPVAPVMLTECGGFSFKPERGKRWYGYGQVGDTAALLARYQELIEAILDSPTIVGFCYTQLTDTEQEANGLLRADRSPKLDTAAVRAINSRPSKAIPSDLFTVLMREADAISQQTDDADNV